MTITASVVANRVSGVAPLGILLDCSGTTDDTNSGMEFHSLFYMHNFGDTGSSGIGNWSYGNQRPKNLGIGPIAAHVYEDPGTYTITTLITNGTLTELTTTEITVTDPDTVFSGAATICVSSSGVPTVGECPAGATRVEQADFGVAITDHKGTGNVRMLFKRGDTFSQAANATLGATLGIGSIGTFGSGARPIVQVASGVHSIVCNADDWRYADIEFDLQGDNTSKAFQPTFTTAQQLTFLRCYAHEGNSMFVFSDSTTPTWDQVFVVDCLMEDTIGTPPTGNGAVGMYFSAARLAMLGSRSTDSTLGEFPVRISYMRKGVISNCEFSYANAGKGCLKLHGVDFALASAYTEQIVISDNYMLPSDLQAINVTLFPQNNNPTDGANRLRDIIFERNWCPTGAVASSIMFLEMVRLTQRNNLFDISGKTPTGPSGPDVMGFYFNNPNVPEPDESWTYNNTAYNAATPGAANNFEFFNGNYGTVGHILRNNLLNIIQAHANQKILIASGSNVTSDHNTVDIVGTTPQTDPLFESPSANGAPAGFIIDSASYAADAGVNNANTFCGLYYDFFGRSDKDGDSRIGFAVPRTKARIRGQAA